MSYTLQIDVHPDYVHFKRTGIARYSEVRESWAQVIQVCNEHGLFKILAETVNEKYLSAREVFDIAAHWPEIGLDHKFQVAHIFAGTEPESLGGRFTETVSQKRGINYKRFFDVAHAKEWLLSD